MNATTTTLGAGTAVLSVDSLAAVINWLALHYQVTPALDDVTAKAAAVLFMATVGTAVGGVWWVVRAIARKWLKSHDLIEENGNGPVVNP